MPNIGNTLGIRTAPNTPIENRKLTHEFSECSKDAQEEFEKALHCVEGNTAKRGRNQRDWDAACLEIDIAAIRHSLLLGAIGGGASAAATTVAPGVPPQVVAIKAAAGAAAGAVVGLLHGATDPTNITRVNPADHFNDNPLQQRDKKSLDLP
jgi:hypothetical protein